MIFRRGPKPPLQYALDFIEIVGETARRYLHDKEMIPTQEAMEQLRALEKAIGLQHCSISYIVRTLQLRIDAAGAQATPPAPPDPP